MVPFKAGLTVYSK